jgi:hypothetical protein
MKQVLIINNKYGDLTVLERVESHVQKSGQKKSVHLCVCECGNEVKVQTHRLKSGHTKTCGCKRVEFSRAAGKKHFTHGDYKNNKATDEWICWRAMKNRCYNKNHKDYKNWGAKGVIVCDRWLESYANFLTDMGRKPSKTHSIDRINPFGNYEPKNCRWATSKEQANNKRNNYESSQR